MAATKKNGGVETVRIQFTLPATLINAIDEYCEKNHMLRSTYVEYTLATSLNSAKEITSGLVDGLTALVGNVGE